MEKVKPTGTRLVRNRVGILAEVKTIRVTAGIWGRDFNFKPVDTYIKFRQK